MNEWRDWGKERDRINKRVTAEVWAKIERYGWLSTIGHRIGLYVLEDVRFSEDGTVDLSEVREDTSSRGADQSVWTDQSEGTDQSELTDQSLTVEYTTSLEDIT